MKQYKFSPRARENKVIEIPIPEGAKRTSKKYCKSCRFSAPTASNVVCDYLCITKQRRNCPVGWCDKKEPRKRVKK